MAQSDFQKLWTQALRQYEAISGKRLQGLPKPMTADDLIKSVDKQNKDYKHFRESSATLFRVMSEAVKPIELVGNLAAGAASMAFPPSSMVFGAVQYLIDAAHGVSASLEAIQDLLERLRDFTVRLTVYDQTDLSLELRGKLTEILVTVIEIFAISTKKIKEGSIVARLKSYGKNALLGNDKTMQGLLDKLEKLTVSEDRLVGAETLVQVKGTGRDMQAVKASVSDASQGIAQIQSDMAALKSHAQAQKEIKILEQLKALLRPSVEPQDRYDQIKREMLVGSGNWIQSEPSLRAWLDLRSGPILWISGNPGSGKSFLTCKIATLLQDLAHDANSAVPSNTAVGYFFFRDNKSQTQSFLQALHDIAYQLAKSDPAYARYISQSGHSADDISSIRQAWNILFVAYWLESAPSSHSYVLLDGLDESYQEDRETFLELLGDVQNAGAKSCLRFALLGRPQVVSEIVDALGEEPSTVHVDSSKNGADITNYIKASIAKHRALNKVSEILKTKITETLTSKADGMFMWVKLMVDELNRKAQRSRESEVEKALSEAPKDLTRMLRHVFESYSAVLPHDQADDLNDMLMWVTLAQRPLRLGELDAALRLRSETGEGVINLEGNLRTTYASIFSLRREDALTTSELMISKRGGQTEDSDRDDENSDEYGSEGDHEDTLSFNSNPKTTTVTLSHASISDFLRDPKQGKVQAQGDGYAPVGIDIEEAHMMIAKSCIELVVDESNVDRINKASELRTYAAGHWNEHLKLLDHSSSNMEHKVFIGKSLMEMLEGKGSFVLWAAEVDSKFFTGKNAAVLLPWLQQSTVLTEASPESAQRIRDLAEEDALEIFEPTMRIFARYWLNNTKGSTPVDFVELCDIISAWLQRRKGLEVEKSFEKTIDIVVEAAEFAAFEKDAVWHRSLAMTYSMLRWYGEAEEQFQKAIELDPKADWVYPGLVDTHTLKKDYKTAIMFNDLALKVAADIEDEDRRRSDVQLCFVRAAYCWVQLAKQVSEDVVPENLCYFRKGYAYWRLAFALELDDCFVNAVGILNKMATMGRESETDNINPQDFKGVELPSPEECYTQTMSLVHEFNDARVEDQSGFIHWLLSCKGRGVLKSIFLAAEATNELGWIAARITEAIHIADTNLQPIAAAYLDVTVAHVYYYWIGEEEKAVKIWERRGLTRALTRVEESRLVFTQKEGLVNLGFHYLNKAIKDEGQSDEWVAKMEKILAQQLERGSRNSAFAGYFTSSPMALPLAGWYARCGRSQEAHDILRPVVKTAIDLLGDDNHNLGALGDLARIFAALRDETNLVAALQNWRGMKDGISVLTSHDELPNGCPSASEAQDFTGDAEQGSTSKTISVEGRQSRPVYTGHAAMNDDQASRCVQRETGAKHPSTDQQQGASTRSEGDKKNDDNDGNAVVTGFCDGPCNRRFHNFDNVTLSCDDYRAYCKKCTGLLYTNALPGRQPSTRHFFLTIPPLRTRFRTGEIVVDGKVVPFDEWKSGLKRRWRL